MAGPSADLALRIYERVRPQGERRPGAVEASQIDRYRVGSDPALLRDVAEALVAVMPERAGVLAGIELGGVLLASAASQVSGLPALFVRRDAREWLVEGGEPAGRRLVVIGDVITSGAQAIACAQHLRHRGAQIAAVLCVIDREAGARESLAAEGIELRALFTVSELERSAGAGSPGG